MPPSPAFRPALPPRSCRASALTPRLRSGSFRACRGMKKKSQEPLFLLECVVMSRNAFVIGVGSAFILSSSLLVAACGSSSTPVEAAPETTAPAATIVDVSVVKATVGTIESSLEISGTLAPRSRVAVKSKVPGTIERMFVDIGNAVAMGQTIATIDRREIDAQVDASTAAVAVAKAALDTADASLANAALEHDRATNLFDKGALPRQRLDAAET